MMRTYPTDADPASTIYQRMVSLIVPRPIAWITTIDARGIVNLAPFSFFNGVCSDPPCLSVAIARNADGSKKDTLRNIETNGEFVVNAAHDWMAEAINASSAPFDADTSEAVAGGIATTAAAFVHPPRVAECLYAFECRLEQLVPIGGEHAGAATLVIGRIVATHIDSTVLDERGRVDPHRLRPVARLGGSYWSRGGEIFRQERPRQAP